MGLNCKQGDLAVIVRSSAGNEGKVVRCLRLVRQQRFECRLTGFSEVADSWETDTMMFGSDGRRDCFVADRNLRPIRDNPGEDEMLRIAGKPNETPAEVIKAARGVPVEG
jgi:hypothetical protein